MQKEDLRVIKTKQGIVNALMELLEKKTWDKISIKDICENALISRSTFYAHFKDKYDLLEYVVSGGAIPIEWDPEKTDVKEIIHEQMKRVKESEEIIKNLFTGRPEEEIITMFSRHFHEIAEKVMAIYGVTGGISRDSVNLAVDFYAAGLAFSVAVWILRMPDVSVETMAETLCWLIVPQTMALKYLKVKGSGKLDISEAYKVWMVNMEDNN